MSKHLTPAQRAAIKRALASGQTTHDVADAHNVSLRRVQRLAPQRTKLHDDEIRAMRLAGHGVGYIAYRTGMSRSGVNDAILRILTVRSLKDIPGRHGK